MASAFITTAAALLPQPQGGYPANPPPHMRLGLLPPDSCQDLSSRADLIPPV